jgi:hypothetical protein
MLPFSRVSVNGNMRHAIILLIVACGFVPMMVPVSSRAQVAAMNYSAPWITSEADGYDRPMPPRSHVSNIRKSHSHTAGFDTANINVTQTTFADQTEPSIAIDPTDANTIIIGANDDRDPKSLWVYTSHDGGRSWVNQMLPSQTLLEFATDPSVSFDRGGTGYFLCGRMDGFGLPYPRNDVVCYRSDDHGDTWRITASVFEDSTRVGTADTLADKYYLAVDNSELSSHRGRIYATWVDEGNDDTLTRIVLAFSDDSGSHWTHRRFVTPDESFYHAPVPSVGRDGQLLIAYIDILRKKICVAQSGDGGASFSNTVLSSYRDLGDVQPPGDSRGYPIIKGDLAVNSFPSIAIDTRVNSGGRAYIVWTGRDSADDRQHVFFSESADGGHQWTAPNAIETDANPNTTDKFFSWIAVDQETGHVAVTYYDSQLDTSNRLCDLFLAVSSDSGATFLSRRVSTASMDPTIGRGIRTVRGRDFKFFGDYIGLAGKGGIWRPAWCDARTGEDLEIFTAAITEHASVVPTVERVSLLRVRTYSVGGSILVQVEGAEGRSITLTVVDVIGRTYYNGSAGANGQTTFALPTRAVTPLFYRVTSDRDPGRTVTGRIR